MPGRIRFRYFLEGFDSSWSQPVSAREAVYTNLAPGHYRFRLVASNSDGLWNGPETAIALNVAPAYYHFHITGDDGSAVLAFPDGVNTGCIAKINVAAVTKVSSALQPVGFDV